MPWISDNWALKIAWNGTGTMSETARDKLNQCIKQAHDKHRKVRFWGAPDKEIIWQTMLDSKVDLINTDRLADLRRYLTTRTK